MSATLSAAYQPFPDVSEWSKTHLDTTIVDQLKPVIDKIAAEPKSVLKGAVEAVKRVAAIETGAIENLYEHDRGITITAAMSAAAIDALRQVAGEQKHAYIDSQLRAYDYVLDLVTNRQPITQVRVRELHAVLCASQETYVKYGPNGEKQDVPLLKGQYKTEDNHVQLKSGNVHYYAPHISVNAEMERLVENLTSQKYAELHPVDQAAYFHYAFVAIHPFSDGNGRVARALTSIPTYKHFGVPILITFDQRDRYFDALETADRGDANQFRTFVRNRIAESIEFLDMSVQSAKIGTPEEVAQQIARRNLTRGGYSHVAIDETALSLLHAVEQSLNDIVGNERVRPAGVTWSVSRLQKGGNSSGPTFRRLVSIPEQMIQLHGISAPPAGGAWTTHVGVEVSVDAGDGDAYRLECGNPKGPVLDIPIPDAIPQRTLMTDMKLRFFAERVFAWVGQEVGRRGEQALIDSGYRRK